MTTGPITGAITRAMTRPIVGFGVGGGAPAWSPLAWFAASEQGGWYDPSSLSSMFQDGAGTTPVTAVEQPVGLIYDKSARLTIGAELVSNGDFSGGTTTGWTALAGGVLSVVGGQMHIQNSATFGRAWQAVSVTANKWYEVRATAVAGTANATIRFGNSGAGSTQYVNAANTTGVFVWRVFATTSTMDITLYCESATIGATVLLDNISIKELAGNHALQATSTARPTLKSDSGFNGLGLLGTDDSLAARLAGGGTTGGTWVVGFRLDALGATQIIWSDAGTNTGYVLRVNSSNQIEFLAGNGSAYTTATVSTALTLGDRVVITAWHDGTTLRVQVNNGTIATAAMGTVTAGSTGYTIGKNNTAASEYLTGRIYEMIYVRNISKSSDLASAKAFVAAASGVTL